MADATAVDIVPCGVEDRDELRAVGLRAFAAAFEAQNNPADYATYVGHAFDPPVLQAELENPASAFFFAKQAGETVGYLKVNFPAAQHEALGDNCLEIQRIYALPEYYGKGVGDALMAFSLELAKAHGFAFVWLGVWERNPRAIRFYHKLGFEVFGSHPFQFGEELQTDLLMRKYL